MSILIASKPGRNGLWNCLFAALVVAGCGFLSTLHGGERITAYLDSSGQVVFVNETPAQLSVSKKTARSKSAAPVSYPKQPSSPEQQESAERPAAPAAPFQSSWDGMIERTANQHRVDPDLVHAIVQVESNFNPNAVSSRGARGLMQLIPSTARRFGVDNIFDPEDNLGGGVRYLKYLMNMFGGDLKLSLAAYNAGENAVDRHNGVPPYPETQDYLRKISEIYPLSSPGRGPAGIEKIQKYVDSKGIVHFSNTDLP